MKAENLKENILNYSDILNTLSSKNEYINCVQL